MLFRSPQTPKQETQYCFSCKQNKPLSHFNATNATKCIECEEQDRRHSGTNIPKEYKICISCGKKKPTRLFNQAGTDICDDCAKEEKPKPVTVQEGLFDKLRRTVASKGFRGALASIAIIVGVVFVAINLPNRYSTPKVIDGGEKYTDTTKTAAIIKTVDKQELKNLVASGNFKAVYEYVKDKKDADNYTQIGTAHV